MLDHRLGIPLYRQLAEHLRERITGGEFPPGTDLPSENLLAEFYNVSRDVVRQAIAVLRGEGILDTARGYRAAVRAPATPDLVPAPPAARISARMPTSLERRHLDIPEGVPLLIVESDDSERRYPAHLFVLHTAPVERGTPPR